MRRRHLLFLAVLGLMAALGALAAQKPKPGRLLVLDWAARAGGDTPPTAVLVELGLKDTTPTKWDGRATVRGAMVVHREGYRFRDGDKLLDPDRWQASSRRPVRLPARQPALARTEGIATTGVVLHLTSLTDDAALTIETPAGTSAAVPLRDVLSGKRVAILDGQGSVRLVTTATPIAAGKTEDDFPAAAYGPDGALWVAYVGYHVRDENRRIEQRPLREQPKDFKSLYTPEFADQVFVKSFKDGKWSEPIAVTDDRQDIVRCAVAVDGDGTVVVVYSAHRGSRHDLYARPIRDGKPGPEQRLTNARADEPVSYLGPVMCTAQSGDIHLASQSWSRDGHGGSFHMNGIQLQDNGWMSRMSGGSSSGGGARWHVAIAAGPDDRWQIACDAYSQGDYDIILTDEGTRTRARGRQVPVAASSRFEARPSLCFDPQGRLWIAYEEGPELWGKDYGALDSKDGNPLYNTRNVRIVCLDNGKLLRPAAELPTVDVKRPVLPFGAPAGPNYERAVRYSSPQIGIDGKGRVWLTYRQKFGSRYSSHPGSYWLSYARRLDGDQWSEPIEIHHSDGLLDYRPVLLPHKSGGLFIVHNTDGRYTTPDRIDNDIYLSYVNLPGEPVEPKLVPHEAARKDPKLTARADAEDRAVQRMRDYRIDAGGKSLRLLRGEFHRHTEVSWDGGPDGSLEDMFRYAIDAARMDWIGNGDHDNGGGREYSWWLIQKLSDAYHVKDHFTPMFTYERSVPYPHGHRNCLFAKRGVRTLPRLAQPDQDQRVGGIHADDTKMLYRYLKEHNGICAVHTSATSMGTDWRDNDPQVEPIVEIYQGDRMSYEIEGAPRAGYDPKSGQEPANVAGWYPKGFINNAFAKGYRLGFQSSSDHWSTHISYMVVLAERHDREAILEAAKKRHVYGATDDIVLDLRSGKQVQGDEFRTSAPPTLEFTVIGTAPLARIDILKDSEVVETIKPGKAEHRGRWVDPKPTPGVHYYYLRVVQENNEIAWASPLWIDYAR